MAVRSYNSARLSQFEELKLRLAEAEEALRAIRSGGVDALVTENDSEVRVFTLQGADHAHRVVLESMSEGVVTLAEDATVLYANKRFAELVGKRLERVLGASFTDFVHPRARERWPGLLARCSDRTTVGELELLGRQRRLVRARLSFSPLPRTGNVDAVVVVVTDITELRQAEERFRRLFDGAADAALVHDYDGRIVDANQTACNGLGYDRDRLLGMHMFDIEVLPQPAELISIWHQAYSGSAITVDGLHRRADGSTFSVELRVGLFVADDRPWLLSLVRDVTERKLAEEEQHRLRSLLFQAQKMDAIGQLAGGVAHDFNNILSAMLLELNLFEANPSPAELADVLKELQGDAKRAAELTSHLLAFSRQQVLFPRPTELNALIGDFLKMLRRMIGENIALVFQPSVADLHIEADAGMIGQVVTNLVLNARDAMPSGGTIVIRTSEMDLDKTQAATNPEARPGQFARIDVIDTGCGIDPKIAERLFEPFFTTKEVGKGTGLGLAVVYGIVKQHKGWVEVESIQGQSSTFHVMLPIDTQPAVQKDEDHRGEIPMGRNERLLVVEDEAKVRLLTARALRELGYAVETAADANEAMRYWDSIDKNVDLLLSDMVMPGGMSGLDLADRLRSEKPNLEVLLMSGYSPNLEDGDPFASRPGMHFLPKPLDVSLLAHKLREILETRKPPVLD